MSPSMHIKYRTIGYHVCGEKYTPQRQLSGHIIASPEALPATIKDALEEHFSLPVSQPEIIIHIVFFTATSDDEARERLEVLKGCKFRHFGWKIFFA